MSNHTKGPWHLKTATSGNYFVYSDAACKSYDRIAGIEYCRPDTGTAEANARLIASAPDLLAALRDCLAIVILQNGNLHADTNVIIANAQSAIAKAVQS